MADAQPPHVLKRSKNGSQTWERGADGEWEKSEQVDPRSVLGPGMLVRRESHDELRKKNRMRDPRVVARLQRAVRKVMMVSAFRDTLKQEVGDEHAAAMEAMVDPAVSPPTPALPQRTHPACALPHPSGRTPRRLLRGSVRASTRTPRDRWTVPSPARPSTIPPRRPCYSRSRR